MKSQYQTLWLELFPNKGIVTKHDQKLLGSVECKGKSPKTYRKPVASKEAAIAFLDSIKGKLDKGYKCLLFNDKQFEKATAADNFAIHYTQKQLSEAFYI